ncbi:aldehyde dehydrogenase [Steroidobacter agaridevorans]|uniref:Aldehyde dehydrogenase n=1 Tax=Steroidobacter agaridevorans TaxID=2695856 RepID=A0A829Y9F3_9GAMM|nr:MULTISPECIES: aldehyde dehydrogenase family protein [Steroidobacteraceae]GFE79222.1 aldehyde dehydrogenase [Steroidobacter agaridevorans]GFE87263.1 aldehyde dehydrogenase [Steroidobacter agaridevorans]
MDYYRCFVNGRWIDAQHARRLTVVDPSNNEPWAEVPDCSPEDAQTALAAAAQAQKAWQSLPAIERALYIEAISVALESDRDHFARLLVREQGKTLREAHAEVSDTIGYMRYAAQSARWLRGDIWPADSPNEHLFTFRVPYGVVVALCAYNYPLALIGRKVGPALVTGNTIVIKPHEATPVTAAEFCRLVASVGVPAGVVNMVTGGGATTGAALVKSSMTRMITLTGSAAAGRKVAELAAGNLAALSLELGGKAPFIVLPDADVDAAVEAAAVARFSNSGQVCICNEMLLVHRAIAQEFIDKLVTRVGRIKVGNPMDDPDMGPLATPQALERVASLVEASRQAGGQVVLGGTRPEVPGRRGGNWYAPTVIVDTTATMPVIKEEIFGPVLPVLTIDSASQAVALVNSREDGLSAYLWSRDNSTIMQMIGELQTGTVFVNKGISGSVHGYHTGHKLSGLGGEDGPYGLENYMQKRTVYMKY